jgi:hypothetical protein
MLVGVFRTLRCPVGHGIRLDCRSSAELEFDTRSEQCRSSHVKVSLFIGMFRRQSLFVESRIRTELEGGAWCPSAPIGSKSSEYLQIELEQLVFVNAIETQGRFDNGQGNEYAEFYRIQYQREKNTSWFTYSNKNTNQTVNKR